MNRDSLTTCRFVRNWAFARFAYEISQSGSLAVRRVRSSTPIAWVTAVSRLGHSEREKGKARLYCMSVITDSIHSKRPTIPFKFFLFVQASPPHLPLLVLTSVGEDDNVRSLKGGKEHAELWTANVQGHLREFRHCIGIGERFEE